MSEEGELKKRMFALVNTFCIHSPEVNEEGEVVNQYIHPTVRHTTDEEKKAIINEAKKEIFFHLEKEDKVGLYFSLKKWLGA